MMNFFPVQLLPRFRNAYRQLPILGERESWTRAEIERFQLDRLNEVWAHARRHVPYYRSLGAERRLPERFGSLGEYGSLTPILDRGAVRANHRGLLAENAGRGVWAMTSGSTGLPLRAFWGQPGFFSTLQARYRFLQAWGIDIFDRSAFLWGRANPFGGFGGVFRQFRQAFEDWLRRRIRLPAYRLGDNDLRQHLARIASFRPVMLYAYSTAAMLLANAAAARGVRLPSLRLAVLSSEPITPTIRQAVESGLGVPVASEYGSMECGFLAGEVPDRTIRVREDRVILETLPGPGGTYRLVVTVLDNPAFPLLRYALGDITSAPLSVPEAGFAILKDVIGRQNDLLLARSGRPIHPHLIDTLFDEAPGVRRWRVHQKQCGSLEVAVERDGPVAIDVQSLERRLSQMVEGHPVQVQVTDCLPPSASGKHRWIISELSAHSLTEVPATS